MMRNKILIFTLLLIIFSIHQAHARYYEPTTGRFLQEDPVWATNLYLYAGNNPITLSDPSGRFAIMNKETQKRYFLSIMAMSPEKQREYLLKELSISMDLLGLATPMSLGGKSIELYSSIRKVGTHPVIGEMKFGEQTIILGKAALKHFDEFIEKHSLLRGFLLKSQIYKEGFDVAVKEALEIGPKFGENGVAEVTVNGWELVFRQSDDQIILIHALYSSK